MARSSHLTLNNGATFRLPGARGQNAGKIGRKRKGVDVSQLIDTAEMYLKTVLELNEEGIPALRARIVERLGQSGPTVSETVSRMERDGLVKMGRGREIEFTEEGRIYAIQVMRRHRLSERLLYDVIKVDWTRLHDEACRWEHVISDDVAERIDALLNHPLTDPYGNCIPAADATSISDVRAEDVVSLLDASEGESRVVDRITESVQLDPDILSMLAEVGIVPGAKITIDVIDDDGVSVSKKADSVRLSVDIARGIYVQPIK
ncbi:metal-dependent transcriptional regulator [Trueperella pyogenes]|uniref:metal-dependent transcriptional regulator n=1 Tax=Trueperella pyogenes TaxID=1661 RepID=UPI00325347F8